jgi:hypothetical protein
MIISPTAAITMHPHSWGSSFGYAVTVRTQRGSGIKPQRIQISGENLSEAECAIAEERLSQGIPVTMAFGNANAACALLVELAEQARAARGQG